MYSNFELVGLYRALNRRIISNSFCDCDIGDENKQDISIFIGRIKKSEKSVNIGYVPRQCIANNVGENMNAPYYISFEIERNDNNLIKLGYVIQQVHLYLRTIGIGSFLVDNNNDYLKSADDNIFLLLAIGIERTESIINYDVINKQTYSFILRSDLFGAGSLLRPAYILAL